MKNNHKHRITHVHTSTGCKQQLVLFKKDAVAKDHNTLMLVGAWLINILSMLDKSDVTFFLGIIMTLCAIINYVVQIKKNIKK